jgi:hypothetical protein
MSTFLWTGAIQDLAAGGGWKGGCHSVHYSASTYSSQSSCVLYATGETATNMDYIVAAKTHDFYIELLTYSQAPGTTENRCTHKAAHNDNWAVVASCKGFGWKYGECVGIQSGSVGATAAT